MIQANPGATKTAYTQGFPTGVTVGFKIEDEDGAIVLARTTSGITETEPGVYRKSFTAPNANGDYVVIWDADGKTSVEELEVGATTDAILSQLTGAQVVVVGPVVLGGDIEIVRGDDYKAADGRALEWTSGSWPDLTDADVLFTARTGDDVVAISKAGSVVTPSGAGKRVRVELFQAETVLLTTDKHRFDILATLSNGNTVTLVRAHMTVLDEVHS